MFINAIKTIVHPNKMSPKMNTVYAQERAKPEANALKSDLYFIIFE